MGWRVEGWRGGGCERMRAPRGGGHDPTLIHTSKTSLRPPCPRPQPWPKSSSGPCPTSKKLSACVLPGLSDTLASERTPVSALRSELFPTFDLPMKAICQIRKWRRRFALPGRYGGAGWHARDASLHRALLPAPLTSCTVSAGSDAVVFPDAMKRGRLPNGLCSGSAFGPQGLSGSLLGRLPRLLCSAVISARSHGSTFTSRSRWRSDGVRSGVSRSGGAIMDNRSG